MLRMIEKIRVKEATSFLQKHMSKLTIWSNEEKARERLEKAWTQEKMIMQEANSQPLLSNPNIKSK